jgi:DNA-binding transcriptional regulator LsrR (DeoR family)
MIKNENLYKKVKYFYCEQDMTQKEIDKLLGKSRQWISKILNSDKNHSVAVMSQ